MNDHDVPVSGAGAAPAAESANHLHAVRPADQTDSTEAGAAPVMEPWEVAWKRSLYIQRSLRDRRYCEQIRDARAEGKTPLTEDEFYSPRETILEL